MKEPISVTPSASDQAMKKGFTLLELMLVVVLMGIVYGMVINVFNRYKEKNIDLTLMNLEGYMQSFFRNNHVSLVCVSECEECLLFIDGTLKKNVAPFIQKDVHLYRYDQQAGVRELSLMPYFRPDGQEEEACFRYDILPDGSRTEMIVQNVQDVYSFSSFFSPVQKYASLNEAIEQHRKLEEKVAE